jgi:DNA-binding MarR family transcriptional regulator
MNNEMNISPFDLESKCYCYNLRKAARAISRRYDKALQPFDINNGQFSTLGAISALQPVNMQDLADRLGLDRTTLNASLKPMERKKLITVLLNESDKRNRQITITGEGMSILKMAIPKWLEAQKMLDDKFGKDSDLFRNQLAKVI